MHIQLSREFETGYSISHPLGVKYVVVATVQSEIVKLHWFSFVVRSTVALTECLSGCGLFCAIRLQCSQRRQKKRPLRCAKLRVCDNIVLDSS